MLLPVPGLLPGTALVADHFMHLHNQVSEKTPQYECKVLPINAMIVPRKDRYQTICVDQSLHERGVGSLVAVSLGPNYLLVQARLRS